MDQRQLASVLFAVVGVFVVGSRLPEIFFSVAGLFQGSREFDDSGSARLTTLMVLSGALLALLAGFALVRYRDRLANRLFPPGSPSLGAGEVQAVAFSVLGCYFVVQGLSRLVWVWRLEWHGAAQIVLGVGLFFGARRLARFWSQARSAAGGYRN